jgi:beta-mannanase
MEGPDINMPDKTPKKVTLSVPKVQVLKHQTEFSLRSLLVVGLAFAAIGGYFIFRSFAATQVIAAVESESMSVPSGASVVSDTTASGGKTLKLTQDGASSATVNLSGSVTSFTITARADQCSGSPSVSVSVDNTQVIPLTTVGTTTYANYSSSAINLASGSHTLSINGSGTGTLTSGHGKKQKSCSRNLYLDVSKFYATLPLPAVSLTANPATINSGQAATLSWTSSNASSCTAPWTTSTATTGSQSVSPTATTTYNISCTGSGGTTSASSIVSVTVPVPPSPTSIYWGAYMEGQSTYAFYYGNPAPNGKPWGNAPWDNTGNTWDRFESNAGKKVSLMSYGQPPPWAQTAVDTNAANISYSRGAIPNITMGQSTTDDLAAIASGTYDTQIKTWATNIKTYNKPIFLRLWWEMNGGWYIWGNGKLPASTYIAAWKHVHDVVAAQGAGNVTWVWCPNIMGGTVPDFSPWYPGDAYVDWTCLDGYNQNGTTASFSSLYDASYKKLLAIAPTKPIMIGEIESLEFASGVKASWINDVLQTQLPKNYPQIKAVSWFNWRILDKGAYQPFTIESSASSQQAFHDSIQSSYYAAPGSFTLPTGLNKVKPLP